MGPSRFDTSDAGAILLGIACYVAIVGWLLVLPVFAMGMIVSSGIGAPSESTGSDSVAHGLIAAAIFLTAGYVTARASKDSPVRNAAFLGIALYVLATMFNTALLAAFDAAAPWDSVSELFSVARSVASTVVGGVIAVWHMRNRGALRWQVLALPRRMLFASVVVAIVPFLFLALTYRP